MKFKNGDEARVKRTNKETMYKDIEGTTVLILDNFCGDLYRVFDCIGGQWILDEEMLEPVDSTTLRMADGTIIGEFNTGGTIPTSEWSKLVFKNGSSIEVLPQKDDTVRGENHFCSGFRCGKIPTPSKPVSIEEQLGLPKGVSIHDLPTSELIKKEFNVTWIDKIALPTATETKEMVERVRREILKSTNAFPKEEKKLKFTFYFNVNEGTRVDKSCNGTIPTITTSVVLDKFGDPDRRKCYSLEGEATCDKVDYDMRQGVLEALANAVFDGNFEKAYDKAVKTNAFCERQDRTCHYCGKVLDTIEEKQAHEAWHVERKKARRERYLLRKRAKEIAFEEAAQKMAKEMMGEQK